jgi:hypothetical protein
VQNGEATQKYNKHIATLFIAGYLHKFNKISKNAHLTINRDLSHIKDEKNRKFAIQQSFIMPKISNKGMPESPIRKLVPLK